MSETQPIPFEASAVEYHHLEMSFEHSERVDELFGALAKAQLDFKPIVKDTENPYYRSKYADLSQCISATQSALAKNGLVVIQLPNTDNPMKTMGLTSVLGHSSGQWIRGTLILPAEMSGRDGRLRFDSQSVGAAMTYARRYAYQAMVGVAAETDDDANAALGIGSKEAAQAAGERKVAAYKAKAKGTAVPGTVRFSYREEDPDLAYLTPSWLLTDKNEIKEHLKPFEDAMSSVNANFLPNGKCYTVRRSEYFTIQDRLANLGWKCVTDEAQ